MSNGAPWWAALTRPAFSLLGTARPWLVALVRLGIAAKGVVQLLIGALALAAALGEPRGRVTDAAGALRPLAREPFGRPLVLAVGIGLLAYATFRLVQAVFDPEHRPPGWSRRFFRLADGVSGVAYLLLGVGTTKLFLGLGAPVSGDVRSRAWTGEALALPYGPILLTLSAAVVAGIALLFLARSLVVRDVCADLEVEELGASGCRAAALLIRVASLVQACLFGTIATLLYRAAQIQDPGQVSSTGGALRLLGARHGTTALTLLAIGLLAMAGSSFVEARFRKLR